MKKLYFLLLVFSFFATANAQIVNIPDANFKAKLLEANTTNTIAKAFFGANIKIDVNNDGLIQESEALLVFELFINSSSISSLVGIEKFKNLHTLDCSNNNLKTLDLSSFTEPNLSKHYTRNYFFEEKLITVTSNRYFVFYNNQLIHQSKSKQPVFT